MSAVSDVESQSAARPRGRCLDTFLITSVVALFVMFLAGLGGALLFARYLESEMEARMTPKSNGQVVAQIADKLSENSYKGQNFAYLRATNSELKNGTMMWEPIAYGDGQSMGALYNYDKRQSVLNVAASGSYFLYVQLNFSCVHVCPQARFTVKFKDQNANTRLTCSVSLPSGTQPVSHTCWSVVTLSEKDSRLLAGTEFTEFSEPFHNWKLELNDSGFGMFRVDR
ncbi:uncharacterized protein LOC130552934 [Triplophysa rosa]|uniref:TNF family profile domain-containing protein n=1 Tax=Triplophysa rosa TaxID=992332 RepID=A0A9W8C856_TRIRA|nr:uncharacterized protein LOC130552934 [Triplophysa rosa]KAI7810911.1 hypothetical protein IRJ41_008168 [Triplophysa rosa]